MRGVQRLGLQRNELCITPASDPSNTETTDDGGLVAMCAVLRGSGGITELELDENMIGDLGTCRLTEVLTSSAVRVGTEPHACVSACRVLSSSRDLDRRLQCGKLSLT